MAKSKSKQLDPEERARRKAAAAARKQREADELRVRRNQQLTEATDSLARLEESLKSARQSVTGHAVLTSHLEGFYAEVDKLAKGKSLFEATDLVVQQANDIIRDAKSIVQGDPYLDRIKEFVPAGNNPVYPDVLIVLRTIQQCLERCGEGLPEREKQVAKTCREARTIVAALRFFVDKDGEWPTKTDIESSIDGNPVDSWFYAAQDGNAYFDFGRLDQLGVQRCLSLG